MYVEYIGYLELVKKGERAVITKFAGDRQINYYFREFREEGMRVLLIKDKRTNQQYFIFYGDVLSTKRVSSIQNASAVSGLNVNKALFNRDILNIYFKLEEVMEFRFEKNVKKILIGNEIGGAVANMFAASLIANTNFKKEEFEVVTFGMPDFSRNFKINFDSKNFALKEDKNFDITVKCCANDDIKRIMLPSAQTGILTKTDVLEAYSNALKKL